MCEAIPPPPIRLHGVVLVKKTQGQLYFYLYLNMCQFRKNVWNETVLIAQCSLCRMTEYLYMLHALIVVVYRNELFTAELIQRYFWYLYFMLSQNTDSFEISMGKQCRWQRRALEPSQMKSYTRLCHRSKRRPYLWCPMVSWAHLPTETSEHIGAEKGHVEFQFAPHTKGSC
jgi:hypothetical protein